MLLSHVVDVAHSLQSVADLLAAAKKRNTSPMELCESIVDGEQLPAGIKPAIRKTLANFVGTVRRLRRSAEKVSLRLLRRPS